MDDICVFGDTPAEHFSNLEKVLSALECADLTVRRDKCEFMKPAVTFLGWTIDGNTVHPGDSCVQKALELRPPKTKKQLNSVLGTFSYLRRFIPDYTSIIAPLQKLRRTSAKF
jgi:hypothetical protein